jgi:hypothetical protein
MTITGSRILGNLHRKPYYTGESDSHAVKLREARTKSVTESNVTNFLNVG